VLINSRTDYCKAKWDEAIGLCKEHLDEYDFLEVSRCETCEKLLEHLRNMHEDYSKKKIPQLLKRVAPSLGPLKKLTHACALAMRSHYVATGVIWGLVTLLIEVNKSCHQFTTVAKFLQSSLASEAILTHIIEMLEDLSHHLDILLIYQTPAVPDATMNKAVVEIFVDVIIFWSQTIDMLRRNPVG
jgi:hypothetical protein